MTNVCDNQSVVYTDIDGNTASIIPGTGLVIQTPTKTLTTNIDGFTNGTESLSFTNLYATVEKTRSVKFDTSTTTKLSVVDTIEILDNEITPTATTTLTSSKLTTSQTQLNPPSNLPITATPYGLFIDSPSTKTYPTTASFQSYPAYYTNLEFGTSQTIDATTPSGFNFVYGDSRNYTKSAGTTSDIERLYFNGFNQNFNWTDANTCKQYLGITDRFSYSGKDANGRISSSLNANTISLICPTLSSQTITNITTRDSLNIRATNSDCSYTITNISSPSIQFIGSATNVIATITNHTFLENSSFWDANWTGVGSMATITNMYGLRLNPPSGGTTTGLTITNNWGVYQEWGLSKNYFAGGVGIGTTSISNALDVLGNATISTSLQVPQITNTGNITIDPSNTLLVLGDIETNGTIVLKDNLITPTFTSTLTDTDLTITESSTANNASYGFDGLTIINTAGVSNTITDNDIVILNTINGESNTINQNRISLSSTTLNQLIISNDISVNEPFIRMDDSLGRPTIYSNISITADSGYCYTLDNGTRFLKQNNPFSFKNYELVDGDYIEPYMPFVMIQNGTILKLRRVGYYLDDAGLAGWSCIVSNYSGGTLNIDINDASSWYSHSTGGGQPNPINIKKYGTVRITLVFSSTDGYLWAVSEF
jgi:hypothetical protein